MGAWIITMQGLTCSYHCCRETHGRIDGHQSQEHAGLTLPLAIVAICYKNCEVATDSEGSILESLRHCREIFSQVRIQRGGQEVRTPPPGKSQVIWVSIGNKQLDPPVKSWIPPPPPGKCWTPSGTLKNDGSL